MGEKLRRVCYVGDHTERVMKILAWVLLAAYAFTFLVLLIFSFLCWSKYRYGYLGGLWKFFLHMWMKLQMVAFFFVLAIYMPCCVKAFLKQLYRIAVSWDHYLRSWIDNDNRGDRDYDEGIDQPLPQSFREVYIRPYILHNMLIFFIVQLAIFLLWIFMKLWDCFMVIKRSCMFTLLNFVEYTLLIVGYLLVLMQVAVFSSLEVRLQDWDHSYFIVCFVICVLYWLVFLAFWVWSLMRLLGPESFWIGTNNGNKYYYFFTGMRDDKFARTYDHWFTLAHFVVGLMIGFLLWRPIPQLIVITAVLLALLLILIVLRPWNSFWLNLADLISQICILVGVVFFLVYAILDHDSCIGCGDREGKLCWIIVLFLWLGLLLGLLLLWLAAMLGYYRKKIPETVTEEDYYYKNKQTFYNEVRNEEVVETHNERHLNNQVIDNQMIDNRNVHNIENIERVENVERVERDLNTGIKTYEYDALQEAQQAQPDAIDEYSV